MTNNRLNTKYKLLTLLALILFTVVMCICAVILVDNMHEPGTHCAIGAISSNTLICGMLSTMFIVMIDIIMQVLVKEYRGLEGSLLRSCKASLWSAYMFFNLTITTFIIAYKHNKLVSIETNTEFIFTDTLWATSIWFVIFAVFMILSIITTKKLRKEIDSKN